MEGNAILLPNDEAHDEMLSDAFAEYCWAYAIANSQGGIGEFAFLPHYGKLPLRYPPILWDDCDVAVWLDPLTISKFFAICTNQLEVWQLLYSHVHPDWDDIVKMIGYPQISYATNNELMKNFIEFDRRFHPDVQPGGLWMSAGFSSLNSQRLNLPEYVVLQVPQSKITYKSYSGEGVSHV